MKSTNETMMQYFEWYLPNNCSLWKNIIKTAPQLKKMGITSVWLPPCFKSAGGIDDTGYGVYDLYDLGEFNQKGNIRTKYGTKDEYIAAIRSLQVENIKVLADIVLNHRMGADEKQDIIAYKIDPDDRTKTLGDYRTISAWTKYNFEGRNNTYSDFKLDWSHFTAIDYDDIAKENGIFRFYGKHFSNEVDKERGNYDYLMGCDVDFNNIDVVDDLNQWGKWFLSQTNVDGFRLDAAKYLYAQGEYNTDLNLLQENLDFWKEITDGWRDAKDDLYIVAEVWSGFSSVAPYYSNFDANFNFDLADAIVSVVRRERDLSGFGLMKNLTRMHESFEKYAGDRGYSDAIFLTNHDQDRVMSVLNNDMDLMKLAADIYLMLPGNPYIYYGEEIGMLGRKPDEDIRFPLKWGNDYETEWRKDTLNMDLDSIEVQLEDKDSLLNHYKSLIAVRNSSDALSSGEMVALSMSKSLVIGQIRYTETEAVFILHNISERDCEVGFSTDDENLIYSTKTGYTLKADSVIIPSKGTMLFSIPVEEVSLYEELEIEIG